MEPAPAAQGRLRCSHPQQARAPAGPRLAPQGHGHLLSLVRRSAGGCGQGSVFGGFCFVGSWLVTRHVPRAQVTPLGLIHKNLQEGGKRKGRRGGGDGNREVNPYLTTWASHLSPADSAPWVSLTLQVEQSL